MTTSPFTENDDFRSLSNAANGTLLAPIQAGAGDDIVLGNGGDDVIQGEEGADILDGGTGNDVLEGGDGNDALSGGIGDDLLLGQAGIDTAAYSDVLGRGAIVDRGDNWVITTDGEGVDQLNGVEIVTDGSEGGARYLLVGNGGFATIQAAIDAANAGDTIMLAAGTYAEAVNINKAVTLLGPNSGIAGNGTRGGEAIITGFTTVSAAAGDVLISGIEFRYTGATNSLALASNNGGLLSLTGAADVTIEDSRFIADNPQGNAESGRAIMLPTSFGGAVTITENFFGGPATNGFSGANWSRGIWSDGTSSALTITGNDFNYVRTAANLDGYDSATSDVSGNLIRNSGSGFSFSSSETAITGISDNTFDGVGTDFNLRNFTTNLNFSLADNAGSSTVPGGAVLTVLAGLGADTVTGSEGDDNLAGFGGAGAASLDGADKIEGLGGADTISGGFGGDTLDGGMGDDVVNGDAGNDSLVGGEGNDRLDGGADIDTARYAESIDASEISIVDGGWVVASDGEGTDTLKNIEIVDGAEDGKILLVGAGGYATIQAAIDAASAGDTIVLAAGTYGDAVDINKAVTIRGPNTGTDGDGRREGEAVITGAVTISAASGDVAVSGVEFRYTGAAGTLGVMVNVTGAADVTIEDNRFYTETAQGAAGSGRAVQLTTGAGGDITIDDNFFGGVVTDPAARFGGANPANFNRAIWSDGSSASLTITDNTVVNARTAFNLDGFDAAPVTTVTGNTIMNSGSGISIGSPSGASITGISGNTFQNVQTDFNLQNVTTAFTFATGTNTATTLVPAEPGLLVLGGTQNDNLTGNSGTDVLRGNGGNDTLDGAGGEDALSGGAGHDSLLGGEGNDALDGGADIDAVGYAETIELSEVSVSGGAWTVASDDAGTDTLANVEIVDGAEDGKILLVGAGGFATIQAAIDAASAGDTIMVASGSFAGATVTKNLTFLGAKHGVAGFTVLGLTGEARDAAGETTMTGGFTVSEGVSVEVNGFRFVNTNAINTNNGSLVQDVVFANNVVVGGSNQYIGNANGVGTVSVTGNFISSASGNGFQINGSANGSVTIEGNLFDGTGAGAAAVNANAIATFAFTDNVVMNTSSHGIQVAGAMGNVTIDGNTFDGTVQGGALDRGAISVQNPQGYTSLAITDNTVTDSPFGVVYRGANDANPGAITPTLSGNDFTGATVSAIGYAGNNNANALTGGAEDAVFRGFDGNDTLTGAGGNDALDGGTGIDKAGYAEAIDASEISIVAGGWVVTSDDEGTDALANIEIVDGVEDGKILLVGAGGYATIQAAIDAASAGDTIMLAAGTYSDAVNIDKAVTLLGPNSGIAGNGTRGGEAIITGFTTVSAAAGDVLISGVEFRYTGATNSLALASNNGGMLSLVGAADVTIEDSRFIADNPQGNAESGRAIMLPTAFGGAVTITDNFFGGPATNGFSGANWNRGIWSDGTSSALTITGNDFNYVRTAANLDGYGSATSDVSGNLIRNSGSGFSLSSGDTAITGISDNTFDGVGTDFNLRNFTANLNFSLADNAGSSTVPGGAVLTVLAGLGADTVTGSEGADSLAGFGGAGAASLDGADKVEGLGGADTISGGFGNDTLDGGMGDDVLNGGAGNDSLVGGEGNDLAAFAAGTTFLKNFDGSVTATGPDGTDQLTGVENAIVGSTPVNLASIPTPNVTIALTTDTGENDAADATSDAKVNGTGRPSTDVTVTWAVGLISVSTTVTADEDGDWSASLPEELPDGAVTVSAVQTDGVGGTDDAQVGFLYDTEISAPSIDLDVGSDTGASSTDDVTADNTLSLSGVAEAGSTVVVLDDLSGATLGTVTATARGTWSLTTDALDDGTYDLVVETTDAAGNETNAGVLQVVVDTTDPDAPTIDLVADSDTGASDTDNLTSDATPSLSGTAEAGSKVEVFDGDTSLGFATLSGTSWTFTSTALAAGPHSLRVVATDRAGNDTSSAVLEVTVDTTTATPTIDLDTASDTGTSDTDDLTRDATPSLSGTAEAGSTVTIFDGMTELGSVTADGSGNWSFTSTSLAAGAHELTVSAKDTAGNTATSAPLTITVDVATATPAIDLDAASDSAVDTDNITTDTTPSFSGTAEAGASVEIFRGGRSVGTVTADGAGDWSFTSAALSDGGYSFTAVSTDLAGNVSTTSTALAVTIDTTAPVAPVLTAAVLTSVSGDTLSVSGTAEANSTIEVLVGATSLGTVQANNAGAWTLAYAGAGVASGNVTARASDAAGNVSTASAAFALGVGVLGGSLTGGADADSLGGGAGADTLVGGGGNDSLDGGAGIDTADYRAVAGGIVVNLASGTASGEGGDSLSSIENVIGSAATDRIFGNGAANLLVGGGDGDVLDGAEGNDTLLGGAGGDELAGGDGFDIASYVGSSAGVEVSLAAGMGAGGDAADDTLIDIEGVIGTGLADTLTGTTGAELLDGAAGNDVLLGGAGADTLTGGEGFDTASYAGSSAVEVNLATGASAGGHATGDVISGIEAVIGGAGSDGFTGSAVANRLSGEGGNDLLLGAAGNDTLAGGLGNDRMDGGDDADSLVGGDGADSMVGGGGEDTLFGGTARDTLTGGAGVDTFVWTSAAESLTTTTGRDLITDWAVGDLIDLSGFDANSVLAGTQGFAFGGRTTTGTVANAGELFFFTAGGSTFLIGGVDNDGVRDFLVEIAGTHTLTGASFVGVGSIITGSASADTLQGGSGSDSLSGLAGRDLLQGGGGADALLGGADRDTLTGGAGADRFIWNAISESTMDTAGRDIITDWALGDVMDFSAIDANSVVAGNQAFTFGGKTSTGNNANIGELVWYTAGGNTFVVLGIDANTSADMRVQLTGIQTLSADSFIL